LLVHVVYGLDGRWHTSECLQSKGCSDLHDPTPCGKTLKRSEFVWEWRGNKEKHRTCPANIVETSLIPILNLYSAYQDGFLWTAGGISAQPAAYMQAIQLIGSEVAKIEKEKQDKKGGSVSIPKRAQRKLK